MFLDLNYKQKKIISLKQQTIATTTIELKFSFSIPEVVPYDNYSIVRVNGTNHNPFEFFNYDPGKPVLPVNLSLFNLEFGSKIISLDYEHSTPEIMNLSSPLIFGRCFL